MCSARRWTTNPTIEREREKERESHCWSIAHCTMHTCHVSRQQYGIHLQYVLYASGSINHTRSDNERLKEWQRQREGVSGGARYVQLREIHNGKIMNLWVDTCAVGLCNVHTGYTSSVRCNNESLCVATSLNLFIASCVKAASICLLSYCLDRICG